MSSTTAEDLFVMSVSFEGDTPDYGSEKGGKILQQRLAVEGAAKDLSATHSASDRHGGSFG